MGSVLQLFVDNTSTTMSGRLKGDIYKQFKQHLGYYDETSAFRGNPHWDGYVTTVCFNREWCKCAIKKDGMHFPTGVISKACDFLRENNVPYEIVDQRTIWTPREYNTTVASILTPHEYQTKTVERSLAAQRGIIKVATGGGKTVIASMIIAELGVAPTIFYVTSTDLLKQAYEEVSKFVWMQGKPQKIGRVGGGYKDIQNITIMTVQTAVRALDAEYTKFDDEDDDDKTDVTDIKRSIAELIRSAKLCICDEVQHWAADTCQVIADNSLSCRWRYGLSATPYRDKGDDILIEACFGKQIVDIPASWLIKNDYLVKPYIAFVPIKNLKGQKFGNYQTTYKQGLVENEFRNDWISRIAEALKEQGRTTLILVQQILHGEDLERRIPNSVFIHGSHSKGVRANHIDLMKSGHASVTISSSIFDEGIDVKPLDALILAGGGKSPTRALQRVGRVIRQFTYPDGRKKKDAYVYDINDHIKYLSDHAKERRRIYRSEPEFDIRDFEIE